MIAVDLDRTSEIPVDLQYAAVGLNPAVGTARIRAGTDFDADSGRAGRALGETDGQAVTGDSGCGADAGSTARQGNRSAVKKTDPEAGTVELTKLIAALPEPPVPESEPPSSVTVKLSARSWSAAGPSATMLPVARTTTSRSLSTISL